MKVAIINKSDFKGGAAVVSFRLMNALRDLGVDARMFVTDKITDSPFVEVAASPFSIRTAFLAERLKIFMANGLNRENLFKADIASDGIAVHKIPFVEQADVICLNWVNQGFLSFRSLMKLFKLGKPIIWTMHDMWNITGICHHAGSCDRWKTNCGLCPLLGPNAKPDDISFSVWNNKKTVYSLAQRLSRSTGVRLHFVAVSNWLADLARQSPLFADMPLSVIGNAFPLPESLPARTPATDGTFTVVMGAARLDDPVKGLPILVEASRVIRDLYPRLADRMRLITFGDIRNPDILSGIALPHSHLGVISGEENIRNIYLGADAVVSTSLYETLPGTLVEGLAYGAVPVAFGRGGQTDIVDHLSTGYIAEWNDDPHVAARNIADGLAWASLRNADEIRPRMLQSARSRFDAPVIARRYLDLFSTLLPDAR